MLKFVEEEIFKNNKRTIIENMFSPVGIEYCVLYHKKGWKVKVSAGDCLEAD